MLEMLKVKNSIHNPLIITGNYQVERFTNAIIIEAQSNCTITLPPLDDTLIGYFLWIKRKDNNLNVSVTIAANTGSSIEGLASINLSPHQSMGVLGFNASLWRYFSKDRFTTVTEADLATVSPAEIGAIIFNTNPGFMFGVGLYYADGTAWRSVGAGVLSALTPIKVNPVTLVGGTSRDIIQWQASSSEWLYRDSLVGNIVFVDIGGNDATAELNNPFRPFASIIAAKHAVESTFIPGTVYVRPGTYNVAETLISASVSYYFMPRTRIICSATPFAWTTLDSFVNTFYCYGYGEFSANANLANVVSLTGNILNFILYAYSLSSSVNDTVRVNGIPNCYIYVQDTIQSSISNGLTLENITKGIIYAGTIFGSVRGIDFPNTSTYWYVNCFSITATTSNAVRVQSNNNIFIDCVSLTSVLSIAISAVVGNLTIRTKNAGSILGTFALDHIDGNCSIIGFNTLSSSPANASAVRIRGNARTSLVGDTITGIVISGGSPILNANINRLISPSQAGNSSLIVTSSVGGRINMVVNTAIGGTNGFVYRFSSPITANILTNYVETLGTSRVLTNASTANIYLKLGRVTSTNVTVFDITGGTNYIEFDSAGTITNNIPVVNVSGNSQNWIKGRLVTAAMGNCLRLTNTSSGTTNWEVDQCSAATSSPILIDTTGNPVVNIWNSYMRCTSNSIIGHVASVTGAGTPIIRLFNCVGTKTNATAKIFSSVNPINVLVYSTFTSNDTSTNTTYLVGNNLVSALVV